MRVQARILAALFAFIPFAARGQEPGDGTEEVMSGIDRLIQIRNDIESRYAVFAIGERHRHVEGKPNQTTGVWRIRSENRDRGFAFCAVGHVVTVTASAKQRGTRTVTKQQHWSELITSGANVKARSGSPFSAARSGYKSKPVDMELDRFLDRVQLPHALFEPLDDLVLHPMFLNNPAPNERWVERLFPGECELLEATKGSDGDAHSKWRWRHETLDFEVHMTHAKEFHYLPVEVKYRSKMKAFPNFNSVTQIDWEKHPSGHPHLPRRIAAVYRQVNLVAKDFLRIHWLLGEAAEDDLFNFNVSDYRLPYEKYFDIKFDTFTLTGERTGTYHAGTPWTAPPDLYIDGARDQLMP